VEAALASQTGERAGVSAAVLASQAQLTTMERRLEEVASVASSGVDTVDRKAEELRETLRAARAAARAAEAKTTALAAEVARLHRQRDAATNHPPAGAQQA